MALEKRERRVMRPTARARVAAAGMWRMNTPLSLCVLRLRLEKLAQFCFHVCHVGEFFSRVGNDDDNFFFALMARKEKVLLKLFFFLLLFYTVLSKNDKNSVYVITLRWN